MPDAARRRATRRRLSALGLGALLLLSPVLGIPANGETGGMDREQAEARLADVLREIESLHRQLDASRSEHRQEQDRLRAVDLQIQEANRALRDLEASRADHEQELKRLETRRADYIASLDERMDRLATQLRGAYRGGRQSRMKLVLNQDDPVRLARMLAYYDYFSRAQVQRIGALREALAELESLQRSIDGELARLVELARSQQDLLERLETTRAERKGLLAQLAKQIGSEESRLGELERNRQDLESLIERLADVLADIPADLGSRLGVAQQKGRLPMPLNGPVQHAFGQARGGGVSWQGWLIGADRGAEVGAIAYGRVAFADWLRGYGLLLIIDHGQGYMSLYGHNETLLQEVGAWVEPGQVISIVGSDPGSGQGLYFELRRNGKAIDPAGWIER